MLIFLAIFFFGCLSSYIFSKFEVITALMASYLFSTMVFPSQVKVFHFSPSTIFAYLLFACSLYIIWQKNSLSKIDNKKILYIVLLYIFTFLFLIPFGSKMDITKQIPAIKQFILGVFPYVAFLVLLNKSKRAETILKYCVIISLFVFAYGIYSYSIQQNLYLMLVSMVYSDVGGYERLLEESRGGLEGRLGGTIGNPVFYAGFLLILFYDFLALIISLPKSQKIWKFIVSISLLALAVNLFLTGSRSSLVALLLGFSIFCLKWCSAKKIAIMLSTAVSIIVISAYVPIFGKYQVYVNSIVYFWDDSQSQGEIKGSSVEMRLEQLNGLADLVGLENASFGFGAGWIQNYISKNGIHPVLLGFESLFFSAIVQYGIIGFILLYILLFIAMFHLTWHFYRLGKIKSTEFQCICSYLISYIVYAFMTGAYFWEFFLCSYVIILKYFLLQNKERVEFKKILKLLISLNKNKTENA